MRSSTPTLTGDAVFVVQALNLGGSVEIVVRDYGFWRPPRATSDRGPRPRVDAAPDWTRSRSCPAPRAPPCTFVKAVRKEAFV